MKYYSIRPFGSNRDTIYKADSDSTWVYNGNEWYILYLDNYTGIDNMDKSIELGNISIRHITEEEAFLAIL